MLVALFCAFFGSVWGIYGKVGLNWTIIILVLFTLLVIAGHFYRKRHTIS